MEKLTAISKISSLNRLNISHNRESTTKTGLSYLFHLLNLTHLELRDCDLNDEDLVSVSRITTLRKLDILDNPKITTAGLELFATVNLLDICHNLSPHVWR